MSTSKYCYAIIRKSTSKLYLESGYLPIFWLKNIANKRALNFSDTIVKRIKLEDLQKLLNK